MMADRRRRSPESSSRRRREHTRSEYDEAPRVRSRNNSASLSSSSSSSYIDISRTFPRNRIGSALKTFFTAPSERRRARRRRSNRLLGLNNSSSSSVNSDLAYGTGFIRKPKLRRVRSRQGKEINREREREGNRERDRPGPIHRATTDAEILAVGAGLREIARKQNQLDLKTARDGRKSEGFGSRESRYGFDVGSSRGLAPSKISHGSDTNDEDGWESASDEESEYSVDSKLAYGSVVQGDTWGFGNHRPHRSDSVVDPSLFGPQNSLHGYVSEPVGFEDINYDQHSDFGQPSRFSPPRAESLASVSQASLQHVYPVPTSDPSRFDVTRGSVVSSRQEPLISSRPGPIPIQQPQPITPVSQSVYEPAYATRSDSNLPKKSPSSSGRGKSLAEAALVGVVGGAIGSAIASNRNGKGREEDDSPSRHRNGDRTEGKEERRREKRDSPDRESRREKRREREREKEDDLRRDRKREKRRDEPREETREERRDRRREENRSERSDDRRTKSDVSSSTMTRAVDPFKYQVADDAFPTPGVSPAPESGNRRNESSPTVVTVDREPDFTHKRSSSVKDRPIASRSDSSRRYADQDVRDQRYPGHEIHDERRALQDAESIYQETEHSTAPIVAGAMGAAVAAVAVEGYRESRSERRRGERRGEYDDYDARYQKDSDRSPKRDPIQEEADRAYREIVMARKIASNVIRSRTPSPDRSVVNKYEDKEEQEIIRIVTPPGMEDHKKKGPYDAPNADVQIDYVLEDPKDLERFRSPIYSPSNSDNFFSRGARLPKERPLLNLVRPTPESTPLPEKQVARSEPAQPKPSKAEKQTSRSEVGQPTQSKPEKYVSRSEVGQSTQSKPEEYTSRSRVESSQTDPNEYASRSEVGQSAWSNPERYVSRSEVGQSTQAKPEKYVSRSEIGQSSESKDRGRAPSPVASTISKGVTWGENETKHYEVESPSTSPVRSRERSDEPKTSSSSTSNGWNAIAAGIMGAGVGATISNSGEKNKDSTSKDNEDELRGPYEYRGVVVEPESPPRSQHHRKPPATGPKPVSGHSSRIPGSFDDDLDFTATLAAGLQDTGFDPNIVIDDPAYRRRSSPPGSNEPGIYRAPFAETVTDLTTDSPGHEGAPPVQGFIVGEVPDTPKGERSTSVDETPMKLSKKEKKKLEKAARRQSSDVTPQEETPLAKDIVEEPESYFDTPKLSKKEQKKRDKAAQRQSSLAEDTTPFEESSASRQIVEEPESYFETPKKSQKKSKKNSSGFDDDNLESRDGPSTVSVPVNAYEDIQNAEYSAVPPATDDWDTPKKSKKKSKRDSDRFDSPSRSLPSFEIGSEVGRSSNKKSKDKSRRKSDQHEHEVDPAEIPLPMATASETGRDDYDDSRKTRRSSTRDSSIFDSTYRGDSQSVVSAGASRYDDDEPRKSRKKSRSVRDDDDVKSVASAPAGDDWDDLKKSKKKDKRSSGGFFGLFGSKSEPDEKDIAVTKDDWDEPKKKSKKSKRSSTTEQFSESYSGNGHSNGNGTRYHDNDGEGSGSRSDNDKKEKSESFLVNAGTLGAGVGLAGAAVAIATHHQQSKAADAAHKEISEQHLSQSGLPLQHDIKFRASDSTQEILDPEITQRQFRPSIDPQYGDLLPLPPSVPASPDMEPVLDLPELPESRPPTPEAERRSTRDRSSVRRSWQETPIKSPSHSAVPLKFFMGNRSMPSSPGLARSSPITSPVARNPETLEYQRARPRPTSWDSTKEYKPLYLVESNRQSSFVEQPSSEEHLPALPPSEASSRSSSHLELNDLAKGQELSGDHLNAEVRSLSIDTSFPSTHGFGVFLDSSESTPKATETLAQTFGEISESIGHEKSELPDVPSDEKASPIYRKNEQSFEDPASTALKDAALVSSIGYFASAHASRPTSRTWLDELPSHSSRDRQEPSPIDSTTKDRSSYLLHSSPTSTEFQDSATPKDKNEISQGISEGPDSKALPKIEEGKGTDIFRSSKDATLDLNKDSLQDQPITTGEKYDDLHEKNEPRATGSSLDLASYVHEPSSQGASEAIGNLQDSPVIKGADTEPISNAKNEDPQATEDFSFTKSKKEKKKDKKNRKGVSRSSTQDDVPSAESSRDITQDTPMADDFTPPVAKKDKKKKGKSALEWEPEPAPETENDAQIVSQAPEEFVVSGSKKSKKKKDKSTMEWEPNSELDQVREPEAHIVSEKSMSGIVLDPEPELEKSPELQVSSEESKTNSVPGPENDLQPQVAPGEIGGFSASETKKSKKKKGKSTLDWEPESELREPAAPITSEESEQFSMPESKKGKKKSKKAQTWEVEEPVSEVTPETKQDVSGEDVAKQSVAPQDDDNSDFAMPSSKKSKKEDKKALTSDPAEDLASELSNKITGSIAREKSTEQPVAQIEEAAEFVLPGSKKGKKKSKKAQTWEPEEQIPPSLTNEPPTQILATSPPEVQQQEAQVSEQLSILGSKKGKKKSKRSQQWNPDDESSESPLMPLADPIPETVSATDPSHSETTPEIVVEHPSENRRELVPEVTVEPHSETIATPTTDIASDKYSQDTPETIPEPVPKIGLETLVEDHAEVVTEPKLETTATPVQGALADSIPGAHTTAIPETVEISQESYSEAMPEVNTEPHPEIATETNPETLIETVPESHLEAISNVTTKAHSETNAESLAESITEPLTFSLPQESVELSKSQPLGESEGLIKSGSKKSKKKTKKSSLWTPDDEATSGDTTPEALPDTAANSTQEVESSSPQEDVSGSSQVQQAEKTEEFVVSGSKKGKKKSKKATAWEPEEDAVILESSNAKSHEETVAQSESQAIEAAEDLATFGSSKKGKKSKKKQAGTPEEEPQMPSDPVPADEKEIPAEAQPSLSQFEEFVTPGSKKSKKSKKSKAAVDWTQEDDFQALPVSKQQAGTFLASKSEHGENPKDSSELNLKEGIVLEPVLERAAQFQTSETEIPDRDIVTKSEDLLDNKQVTFLTPSEDEKKVISEKLPLERNIEELEPSAKQSVEVEPKSEQSALPTSQDKKESKYSMPWEDEDTLPSEKSSVGVADKTPGVSEQPSTVESDQNSGSKQKESKKKSKQLQNWGNTDTSTSEQSSTGRNTEDFETSKQLPDVEPEQISLSKSKKSKKKSKLSQAWTINDVEESEQTTTEKGVDDFGKPVQSTDVEPESTASKGKKNKKKSKSSQSWDDFTVSEQASTENTSEDTTTSQQATDPELDEWSMPESKKSKKKSQKTQTLEPEPETEPSWDDIEAMTSGVTQTREAQTSANAKVEEKGDPKTPNSKKGKKKSKKSQSWGIEDETTSESTSDSVQQHDAEAEAHHTTLATPVTPQVAASEEHVEESAASHFPSTAAVHSPIKQEKLENAQSKSPSLPTSTLPTAVVVPATLDENVSKEELKDKEGAGSNAEDSIPRTVETADQEPQQSESEPKQTAIDGLSVGYNEEQLRLAKQMQEEFNAKKSKKDKKKRQSSLPPPTTETNDARSRQLESVADVHHRSRSLSVDPQSSSQNLKRPSSTEERKSLYSEEQLELACQLKAKQESGGKKSKKDKNKRQGVSRSRTQDDMALDENNNIGTTTEVDDTFKFDILDDAGFAAGYQEDQLSLARQLQAEFGSGTKKSKKDKKRRSTSQTPIEDLEPRNDYFEDPLAESSELVVPETSEKTAPDGLAAGYKEDQLELARQLKEEFGSGSKKSKKDRKRQSLLRSATEDDFSSNSPSPEQDIPSAIVSGQTERETAIPEDEFGFGTKKSKKGKKRESLLRTNTEDGFSSGSVSKGSEEVQNVELGESSSQAITIDPEDEFVLHGKKSKKSKKRQSLLRSTTGSDNTSDVAEDAAHTTEQTDEFSQTIPATEEDFASTGKKSKKDRRDKKRQSLLRTATDDDIASDSLAISPGASTNAVVPPDVDVGPSEAIPANPDDEFAPVSKQSKKDRKKQKTLTSQDIKEDEQGTDASSAQPSALEASVVDTAKEPETVDAFGFKKSKKDKKKRQSLRQSSTSDGTPEELVKESGMQADTTNQNIREDTQEAATILASAEKDENTIEASPKDEKEPLFQSSTFDNVPEQTVRDVDLQGDSISQGPSDALSGSAAVLAVADGAEEFLSSSSKKSKNDKKKPQSLLQSVANDEPINTSSEGLFAEPEPRENTSLNEDQNLEAPDNRERLQGDVDIIDTVASSSETPFSSLSTKKGEKDQKKSKDSSVTEPAQAPEVFNVIEPSPQAIEEANRSSGGLTRKVSKKDKRKRQTTTDETTADVPTAPEAATTSWADEVEAADAGKGLSTDGDKIANPLSTNTFAENTVADDFFRPTKKGKKGKKNNGNAVATEPVATAGVVALPTETESSKGVDDVGIRNEAVKSNVDEVQRRSTEPEDEHGNREILAAAGEALITAALLRAKDGNLDESLKAEASSGPKVAAKEVESHPTKKLSKKEKRKKNIDKRTAREDDIFDDPMLWEGAEPRPHKEVQDVDDGSDDFWSAPDVEDDIPETNPVDEVAWHSNTPAIPKEQVTQSEPVGQDTPLDTSKSIAITLATPPEEASKEVERSADAKSEIPATIENKHGKATPAQLLSQNVPEPEQHQNDIPDDFIVSSKKDKKAKKQHRSAARETPAEPETLAETSSSQDQISQRAQGWVEPPNVGKNISYEEAPIDHSPVPSSNVFRRSASLGLPVLREEAESESRPHESYGTPDANRDSAFVTDSPIPPQRGFSDTHEHIRDSGVHLRDYSPAGQGRGLISTDDALARLSWPPVNEDAETVDLNRSQRPKGLNEARPQGEDSQQPTDQELEHQIQDTGSDRPHRLKSATYGDDKSAKPLAEKIRLFNENAFAATTVGAGIAAARSHHSNESPRSSSGQSQRSNSNINRLRTPDAKIVGVGSRPDSVGSNRSGTPPLRRSDRKLSGDLRSLSQRRSSNRELAKEAELAATSSPTSSNVKSQADANAPPANPTANEGRVRAKDMADVYDGFGEGRLGSPRSPTRPHSMRRRQSMQVLELESRLEQLAAENRILAETNAQTERALQTTQRAASALADRDAEIDSLKQSLDWLHREVTRLTEVNEGLTSANVTLGHQQHDRFDQLEAQHAQTIRELQDVRTAHDTLSAGMDGIVQNEVQKTMREKDLEIEQLRAELEAAKERIMAMQREILASKASDSEFLTVRDEDYFDNACQALCQHVQQWVLRFSKFSDMRACRLTREINNDKIIDRLDNAILDGSDVDSYLADRVKRRDVFMSMTMTMVWEFVFTRYLFGMDREQRQKLKSLEKLLSEVGPPSAVHQWRATTLTLLAKRQAFLHQREQDTEAVVHEILNTLFEILPPPSHLEDQIGQQLRRVMKAAVDLSIEMRTQRAEYMMLPPLQPEYDANGDLASKVSFNAALMNERSGDTVSNEELEAQKAVVRVVLFPLVVKKGDDKGEGDEEIVVCPAQVLVAKPKKTVRVFSPGSIDNRSRVSMQSSVPAAEYGEGMEGSI